MSASFHVTLVCQISCRRILVLTVTSITHPNGSKTCEETCSMSIFVIKVFTGGKCLVVASNRMSVVVFPVQTQKSHGHIRITSIVLVCDFLKVVDHDLRLTLICLIH